IERRAFRRTLIWTFLSGAALDEFFGNQFFRFPNHGATLGWMVPGRIAGARFASSIPVEEFAFYVLGFTTILLVYIWGDVYWFRDFPADRRKERAAEIDRLLRFHPATAAIAFAILAGAIAARYWTPAARLGGFPGYLTYLLVVAAFPSLGFFATARP